MHLAVGKAARAQNAKENKEEIQSMQVVWVEVIAQHLREHSMHTAVTLSQLGALGLQRPEGVPKSSTLGKVLEQHGASCGLVVMGKGDQMLVHLVGQDSGGGGGSRGASLGLVATGEGGTPPVHHVGGKTARVSKAKEHEEAIQSMQVVWLEMIAQCLREHGTPTPLSLNQLGALGLQRPEGVPKSSTLGKVLEQHGASCGLVVMGKGEQFLPGKTAVV